MNKKHTSLFLIYCVVLFLLRGEAIFNYLRDLAPLQWLLLVLTFLGVNIILLETETSKKEGLT